MMAVLCDLAPCLSQTSVSEVGKGEKITKKLLQESAFPTTENNAINRPNKFK